MGTHAKSDAYPGLGTSLGVSSSRHLRMGTLEAMRTQDSEHHWEATRVDTFEWARWKRCVPRTRNISGSLLESTPSNGHAGSDAYPGLGTSLGVSSSRHLRMGTLEAMRTQDSEHH